MTIAFWRAVTLRLAVNRNFCRRSLSLLFVLALPLTACLPPAFTTENILAVKAGMTSVEVMDMFGRPHSVSSTMCGVDVGEPWQCTTWEYGSFLEGSYASFTFAHKRSTLVPNHYNIDR